MTFGTDAGAAIEPDYDFESASNAQYIVVEVNKSEIAENSMIRLTMDVQFEDIANSAFLHSISNDADNDISNPQRKKSGYLITIKLPMAENWRQYGKRLKVKISADTDIPSPPTKNESLPISLP